MQFKEGGAAEWAEMRRINDESGYGKAIADYVERWAALMEDHLAAGETVETCADKTSYEANTEGITGAQYGIAVQVLSKVWEHGDALRIWHNARYGVSEEQAKGGTVNPAILTIDAPPQPE